jgi:hypothetical protein
MIKILAGVTAVTGAAALTVATMIALVRGTIFIVSIGDPLLRVLAVIADVILGTVVLVGCIYLATHLAVRILGVGNAEFLPVQDDGPLGETHPSDPPRN